MRWIRCWPRPFLFLAVMAGVLGCSPGQEPRVTSSISMAPRGPVPANPFPVPSGYRVDGADPYDAFVRKSDGVWVVGTGIVERILRDDTKPPRHQRFVLRLTSRTTLLVAHNIDLAPRVPLKKGDRIGFRGEYVWNDQGGIVHFTHRKGHGRDRDGGGWLVRNEQGYR